MCHPGQWLGPLLTTVEYVILLVIWMDASCFRIINTTIKTTSVSHGDTRSVDGGSGWLAADTDGLAGDG